jgi:hypothetical protein
VETPFEELVQSDVERFQEKIGLRPGADIHMILLKAHLLIEEELQAFIDKSVRDASLLKKARFTFAQRLILAEALHPAPNIFRYGWVWGAAGEVNALRNQVAHDLEPKDFATRTKDLANHIHLNIVLQGNLMLVTPGEGPEYEMAKFGLMVSALNLCLARLLHFEHHPAVQEHFARAKDTPQGGS